MINAKTLRGLHGALLECVPGRAQRRRLLDALTRVSGNKTITEAIAALKAREDEATQQRDRAAERIPPPPASGVFRIRAQVIPYTQAAAEVQITMPKDAAAALLSALESTYSSAHQADTPTGQLHRSLSSALEGRHACR